MIRGKVLLVFLGNCLNHGLSLRLDSALWSGCPFNSLSHTLCGGFEIGATGRFNWRSIQVLEWVLFAPSEPKLFKFLVQYAIVYNTELLLLDIQHLVCGEH